MRKPKPKAKSNPIGPLPDSRLRMHRRPQWLADPVDLENFSRGKCRTWADLVDLAQFLGHVIEDKSFGDDHPICLTAIGRRCRVCQCTQADCSGCAEILGDACTWSKEDNSVCTACVVPLAKGGAQ
jgi:hypothetical protein